MRSFGLGFLLGCLSLVFIDRLFPITWLALVVPLVLFLWFNSRRINDTYRFFLLGMVGIVVGFSWNLIFSHLELSHRLPFSEQRQSIEVVGEICSIPRVDELKTSFYFCVDSTIPSWSEKPHPIRRIYLSWYNTAPELNVHQIWQLDTRLLTPYSKLNPGSFDIERWALINGIDATGYVSKGQQLFEDRRFNALFSSRSHVIQWLDGALEDSAFKAWHLALMTGYRDELSESDLQLLKASGTAHLVAISGLHIGLIFLWSYFVVNRLWRCSERLCLSIPAEKVAIIAAFFFAIVFAFLSGMALPAQRALIALAVYVISCLSNRKTSPTGLLSVTVIALLIHHPLSVLSESFWLSFSAIAVIYWVLNAIKSTRWRWIKLQLILSVAMSSVSALIFGYWSSNAFIANLIAIPTVSFIILPADLLMLIFGFLSRDLMALLVGISDFALDYLTLFLSFLNHWLEPLILAHYWNYFVLILGVSLLFMNQFRDRKWLALVGINLGLILTLILLRSDQKGTSVYFLDIGQGTSIVIRHHHRWMVYDTGFANDQWSAVKSHLLPFLNHHGVDYIDTVIVSHRDLDHSGDVSTLLQQKLVNRVISGEPLSVESEPCNHGLHSDDRIRFQWLQFNGAKIGNDRSCLLKITVADRSILLSGDIEFEAELWLLKNYREFVQSDVLLVPHHGSKTSSSWSFVVAAEPEIAVVSAGYANRFNHPSKGVSERYRSVGTKLLTTWRSGLIEVNITDEGKLQLKEFRMGTRNFWNHGTTSGILDLSVID